MDSADGYDATTFSLRVSNGLIGSMAARAMGRAPRAGDAQPRNARERELVQQVEAEYAAQIRALRSALRESKRISQVSKTGPSAVAAARSDEELVGVAREYVQSLHADAYPFTPKPLRCEPQRKAFMACMSSNSQDIMACAESVHALSACSRATPAL